MKKVLVVLAAAALLCCSCSGDKCKCTTKIYSGDGEKVSETTTTTAKPDSKKCSDVAKDGIHDLGEVGKTVVTCKTVSE